MKSSNLSISFLNQNPTARYVTPFAVFMIFTAAQDLFTGPALFSFYGLKIAVTAASVLFCFKGHWTEIEGRFDFKAVVLGLVVLALWIWIPIVLGIKPADGTFAVQTFTSETERICGLIVRIIGAALIVPIIEELFWRSFLMRYLITQDFLSVKIGTFTAFSFWAVIFGFTLEHRSWEWPAAVVTGILYGGYCVYTKNLKGCILAHAVTNLGLALYVLYVGDWAFW